MRRLCTAVLAISLATPAFAQNMSGASEAMGDQVKMPPICDSSQAMAAPMPMAMDHQMDEAHSALMGGMDRTNQQMMTGMMADDIDVAFVCGMVAHHQGAINMARAELKYGDDAWAKEMAQNVIDAQQKELTEMLGWLDQQAQ